MECEKGRETLSPKTPSSVSDHVSKCLQLAILLEVSASPKPGNVHRTADFQDTSYEHFLASAVALVPHFRHAAERGLHVLGKDTMSSQIGIGKLIRAAVKDVLAWQHGGNTLLGSIILLTPIAAASGLALSEDAAFSVTRLRGNLKHVCSSTTVEDAVNVYDAITLIRPGGLGKVPRLDVTDVKSRKKILEEGTTLFKVFEISSSWDSISAEWVDNFPVTFDLGYPFFKQQLKETENINIATVHTFLKILSKVTDTLIIRKAGADKARWVSCQARKILEIGGLTTERGIKGLSDLDRKLHDQAHRLNPGTTADITSAILALAVLDGYRP
jgi:triphosphoribosyl-dephospho-CoA synthase